MFTCFLFKNATTTCIYTLSLHDALPICPRSRDDARIRAAGGRPGTRRAVPGGHRVHAPSAASAVRERDRRRDPGDRKSTRLNSSHVATSYAVFCLKKKICLNKLLLLICI